MYPSSGTYPWSCVTQIFHTGQPSHRSDRKSSKWWLSNLFEYQYDRCNQRNNQTYNYLVKGQKLHEQPLRKLIEQPLRKLIEQPFDLFSGGYLSEVNVEQLYLNMKTAWYTRVEMKRLTQVNVFLHWNLFLEFRKIYWLFMPNNLLFLGPGQQHRPHPLRVKWSFPYIKSTVQITKVYIYFNYSCRYLHIF